MRNTSHTRATVLHVRCPPNTDPTVYRLVLGLLHDITPVVQPLPPTAALANLAGALSYFNVPPSDLAQRLRLRALALYGIDVAVGAASTRALATMASARPGVTLVPDDPASVAAFLHPMPVDQLDGIGPVQATTLRGYGLHTIGALADVPRATLQRLLGGRAGRTAADRARGLDHRQVLPAELPHTITERRDFDYDELDPERHRTALLDAVVTLAARLRDRHQVARTLTLTVRFAGRGSDLIRSRSLREASAHTDDLQRLAYELWAGCGFQRARVRRICLCAEGLSDSDTAGRQLTMDPTREARILAEAAIDQANRRFGWGAVRPARLAHRPAG